MCESYHPGQDVGKRLLPHVVSFLGEAFPNDIFVIHHTDGGSDYSRGWSEIKFMQLAKAVDWTAWWLHNRIGSSDSCETIAFIGCNDVRYSIFTLAAQKAGYATLLPSPRNGLDAHKHLVKETQCKHFFFGEEQRLRINVLKDGLEHVQFCEIPSLNDMLHGESKMYPFDKTFEQVSHEPVVIIHSSGTTGLPKLVPLSNGYLSVQDRQSCLPPSKDGRWAIYSHPDPSERIFSMTPMFHLMAYWQFQESIFHRVPVVLAPEVPLTADILNDIHLVAKPTLTSFPPSMLEDLSGTPEGIKAVSQFRTLMFGGAPLSTDVGQKISQVTGLCTIYGTSEIGVPPILKPQAREDWNYLEFHSEYGIEFEPTDGDHYEAVIRRRPGNLAAVFYSFPDVEEYRTQDLFTKHPSREGLWLYRGRNDDVIVLNNGEKFNPILVEKCIEEHSAVNRAVVIGQGRFQSLLLLQPEWGNWHYLSTEEFVEDVWPVVERANSLVANHGRVMKTHIVVGSRTTPFQTTPKGNIKRKNVEQDYFSEIESAYSRIKYDIGVRLSERPDYDEVESMVFKAVSQLLTVSNVSASSDLYSTGLDSLQNLQLVRRLQSAVRPFGRDKESRITPAALYSVPTVAKISTYVLDIIENSGTNRVDPNDRDIKDIGTTIQDLVEKYIKDIPKRSLSLPDRLGRRTVLITGSTGYLGSYVLHHLIQDVTITHIYCLNRSGDAFSKACQSFVEKSLDFSRSAQAKVTFWQSSFGEKQLGLSDEQYDTLRGAVDVVIHNAWKVDFNHQLESFEDTHIRGIRNFVDFAIQSPKLPHLVFISSQSTVGRWADHHGPSIPEQPHANPDVAARTGYGLSKYTAERILHTVSERTGLPTTIIRIGQIGGPLAGTGAWSVQDWVPTVIRTSKTMRQVPLSLSYIPIDWIPVDCLARIVSEIVETRLSSELEIPCDVFHLVNPRKTSWRSLLPAIHRQFAARAVSFEAWVESLRSIEITDDSVTEMPALKLLDFLQNMAAQQDYKPPPLETVRAQMASRTMRELPPVDEALLELYLRQWKL
ncbi:hypothetical protein PV08_05151 [Exophiala spinifera]|uniref:Carrier domain-containing protein n=1 Tax=Exophiala spinifera TaxID=91928 RepID=A0A0D1YRU8_9EURO|nr:uncharacterized protein PV08_05151 [Exophiala spinifera]KIW17956.1 hypothetical protein PV08_05151 [Exophiala spinifera]